MKKLASNEMRRRVAIVGGGTVGRILAQKLKDTCSVTVTLISKDPYSLDDYYKLTNACGFPSITDSKITMYSGPHLNILLREVLSVDGEKDNFSVKVTGKDPIQCDEVVFCGGAPIKNTYNVDLIKEFNKVDSNFYTTHTTLQSFKTRFRLYESKPGTIVFYSPGADGKGLYDSLSVCMNFEARVRALGDSFRELYDIHFITKDRIIYPNDIQMSIELSAMLKERGIKLTDGASIDEIPNKNSIVIKQANGVKSTIGFDTIFLEPETQEHALLQKLGSFDNSTCTFQTGVYAIGKTASKLLGPTCIGSIRSQADFVSERILSCTKEEYNHQNKIDIFTGNNRFIELITDKSQNLLSVRQSNTVDLLKLRFKLYWRDNFKGLESSKLWNPLN